MFIKSSEKGSVKLSDLKELDWKEIKEYETWILLGKGRQRIVVDKKRNSCGCYSSRVGQITQVYNAPFSY